MSNLGAEKTIVDQPRKAETPKPNTGSLYAEMYQKVIAAEKNSKEGEAAPDLHGMIEKLSPELRQGLVERAKQNDAQVMKWMQHEAENLAKLPEADRAGHKAKVELASKTNAKIWEALSKVEEGHQKNIVDEVTQLREKAPYQMPTFGEPKTVVDKVPGFEIQNTEPDLKPPAFGEPKTVPDFDQQDTQPGFSMRAPEKTIVDKPKAVPAPVDFGLPETKPSAPMSLGAEAMQSSTKSPEDIEWEKGLQATLEAMKLDEARGVTDHIGEMYRKEDEKNENQGVFSHEKGELDPTAQPFQVANSMETSLFGKHENYIVTEPRTAETVVERSQLSPQQRIAKEAQQIQQAEITQRILRGPAEQQEPSLAFVQPDRTQVGPSLDFTGEPEQEEQKLTKPVRMSLAEMALQPGAPEKQKFTEDQMLSKAEIADIDNLNAVDAESGTSEKMSKEDWAELDALMEKKPSRMKNMWKKFMAFAARDGATDSDRIMGGAENMQRVDRNSQADRYGIRPAMAASEMQREDIFSFIDADTKKILALENAGVNGQLEGSEIATLALKASDMLVEQYPELKSQADDLKSARPDLTYNQIFKNLNESSDKEFKLQMVQELNYRSRQNAGTGRDAGSKKRFAEAAPAAKPAQVVESSPDTMKKAA